MSTFSWTCPGCGEKAVVADGKATGCQACRAFVHLGCLQQIEKIGKDKGWKWVCPVCREVVWKGYLNILDGHPVGSRKTLSER